jgi:hypothetical protein
MKRYRVDFERTSKTERGFGNFNLFKTFLVYGENENDAEKKAFALLTDYMDSVVNRLSRSYARGASYATYRVSRIEISEKEEQFIFYSYFPVKVSEDRRAVMAEFLTRANYGMIIGNFELDLSDGEVRYKTSIDVEDAELSHALAKHIVYANVLTMDRYYKGLVAVAGGGMTAAEAIKVIET